MSSFLDKLSNKLNKVSANQDIPPAQGGVAPATSARGEAAGEETAKKDATNASYEDQDDSATPLDVDIFQSEARIVIFMQASGVAADGFDVTYDEAANAVTVQATQKRPELPECSFVIEGQEEKGRFVKQEIKWQPLYRKAYLPAPVDGNKADVVFEEGVLMITLPVRKLGEGKRLAVREIVSTKEENPSPENA